MADKFVLGEPEFGSTSDLRTYCLNARTMIRPLAHELRLSAEELQGALKEIRNGDTLAKRRWKARIVSNHLRHAADGVEDACIGAIRTFLSFERHFINDSPEKSKRHFDLSS
ncbi:hypothetical protein [Actinokineospora sp. NBRC 105648]|uniref:hypothetical protein n=1 Tax=Actinokineospora sp. NBRC 105648 TaxID=3032206 RepID=UPI0024A0265D|nr:hypothetical protein [Actinokineospora sp. NBRC 105648]GLZ43517.1 hypothetical protein Acsp05_71410 [Actinokineospora sp. NBRC 105648]